MSVKEKITSSTGYSPQKIILKTNKPLFPLKNNFSIKKNNQTATNVFMTML